MGRFIKGLARATGIFLLPWLVGVQSCRTYRIPDKVVREEFTNDSLSLTTATIRVSGRHLHYAMIGNDTLPTLYFVHGSPGGWIVFKRYMKDKDLLKRFRMVSIDRPGFGYSDYGSPEHLANQSALISPLFSVLDNHKPAFIAGHSLGGPMVVKLVADNPGVFYGMVVLAGAIDPAEEEPERWRPVLYKTSLNYLVTGARKPSNEELWYLKKDLVGLKADFARITCPVYFVHGTIDPQVPPANVEYGKKMLVNSPRVEITMIPGAKHGIPWQHFEEIKAVLMRLY